MRSSFSTSDLYDAFPECCTSCETQFKQYGGRRIFEGRIRTVQCNADNLLLRKMLATESAGEIVVVDGYGYLGSALMGDNIAELGRKNGWSGAVIFGAVRDVVALPMLDFGIKAIGSNPKRSDRHGLGSVDSPISFGGVTFVPGKWLYSDDDGVIVSVKDLLQRTP